MALNNVKNKSEMAYFLVVKINNGKIEQAFPCDMCAKLMIKQGFKKMLNINKIKF